MINKSTAIEKLNILLERGKSLPPYHINGNNTDFKKWHKDVEIAISHIFSNDDRKHLNDFNGVHYNVGFFTSDTPDYVFVNAHNGGLQTSLALISSFIDEIKEYWSNDTISTPSNNIDNIRLICNRFHSISRQLLIRHSDRNTIEITDEYDVQDLMCSLLRIYFTDIRQEEYTPSYAGGASRIDFLLSDNNIALEIKKTRDTLKDKELGSELLIDIQRYRSHPNVEKLLCFIYDPDGKIRNPEGLKKDLENSGTDLQTEVIIAPRH